MKNSQTAKQFDFGQNWKNFSDNQLDANKLKQSQNDFYELVRDLNIKDKTFIDIGFGQGLGLLTATTLGAKTVGLDINEKCHEVLKKNKAFFPELKDKNIQSIVGSILDLETVKKIQAINQKFDVVHSWGVLHHTGNLWLAIDNCCQLLNENGIFILAIYNRHWTSGIWKLIKRIFNSSPLILKYLQIYLFYALIYVAKFLVTFKNPLKKERGMSFYYDVVDWIGGYPYEYASKDEICEYLKKKGFKLVKFIAASVPTGCNEFIFEKVEKCR